MSSAPGGECLLHPELMSSEAIIEVLLARKVKIEGLNSMAREDLINLYNQFCLPHSQRKPRDSARGKASNTPADKAPAADTKPKIYTLPPGLMIDKTGRIVSIIDPNDPNNLTSFTGTVRNFYAIKNPPVANDSKRKRSDDPSNNPLSDKNQRRRIVWPSKENDELTENMSALNFVVNLQTDSIDNA